MTRWTSLPTRRLVLGSAAAGAAAALASGCQVSDPAGSGPVFRNYPFSLGVASGDPTSEGVVLWTRLAPNPLDPDGGMGEAIIDVAWEIAEDEAFARIVKTGVERALPGWGHAVHAEVYGLAPGRTYFYRFHTGGVTSPTGVTKTATAYGAGLDQMKIAWFSCSHYEQGYFHAYRDAVNERPDLVIHTGDYIYESSWGPQVRRHPTAEPYTLEDYRLFHALYRLDPDLQALAGVAPWLMTWDDHEVDNDYAGDVSEEAFVDAETFRARRLAAYQAYWENMPLRRRSMLERASGHMRIWGQSVFGDLAEVNMTDGRQFKTPMPCNPEDDRGGNVIMADCEELFDPERTYLGSAQESWLNRSFARSGAKWHFLVQPTVFAPLEFPNPDGDVPFLWSDGWDGYPLARQRLIDMMASREGANPILLGGDTHCFWVSEIRQDYNDPDSMHVGADFVTSAVTSHRYDYGRNKAIEESTDFIKHFDSREQGYGLINLTKDQAEVHLRVVGEVKRRDGFDPRDQKVFIVEDGARRPVEA